VQAPGKYRGLFWAGSSQHQPLPWIATHANEPLEKISISHRIPTLARFVEGNPTAVVAIQGGQLFVGDAAAMSELIGSGTGWVASRKQPLGPMDGGITWMSDGRHGVIRLMNSGGIWVDADMRHVSIRNPDGFSVLNTGIDHAMTVARSAIGPQGTVVREVPSPRRGLVSLEFTPSPKVEA